MLTRIRNAVVVRHDTVQVPASNMKVSLAKILKDEGFIRTYDIVRSGGPQPNIRIFLHYRSKEEPAITGLKRVSKPGPSRLRQEERDSPATMAAWAWP